MRYIWIGVFFIFAQMFSACANKGELKVMDAWARPMPQGQNSAAYFIIANGTATNDSLLSASTDIAEVAEAHMSTMDNNGVMSMQRQETVPVPAGGQVEFKPGGLHIMLLNLKQELKPGDTFTLTLNFKEAGSMIVEVLVREP